MAITIKKEQRTNSQVLFGTLKFGDPFLYHDIVYIKVYLLTDADETGPITAINLSTGREEYFDSNDVIIPIEATLTYQVQERD